MSNSTSGTPAYIKWCAGILLVLAFAFAWYVIARDSDSDKVEAAKTEVAAKVDSVTTTVSEQASAAAQTAADSLKGTKIGNFLNEAAQAESVAPYEPNNE
ncbi:MAG: hypothetical protein HDT04_03595 [Bacteroidales bacterium]|nr:hypothetical protein [Bacteroidales bacterium]